MWVGAVFLTAMMLLIVANVVYRLLGHVIAGSYELSELMIVVTAAFALGYAALEGSHVAVRVLTSRFSRRVQLVLGAVMAFISLGVWGVIAWTGTSVVTERWLSERTDLLEVPFLPFRLIWILGLGLVCLVYLAEVVQTLRKLAGGNDSD